MLCPLWALNNNFLFSPFASAIQMQAGWFDDSPFCTRRIEFPSCKIPGENRFHQFAARQCSYHLSVYNLVYRIKVSAALSQNQYKNVAIPISNRIYSIHPFLGARNAK